MCFFPSSMYHMHMRVVIFQRKSDVQKRFYRIVYKETEAHESFKLEI